MTDAADEIESMRQQLAEVKKQFNKLLFVCAKRIEPEWHDNMVSDFQRQLTECQAREKVLLEMVYRWLGDEGWGDADMGAYDDCLAGDSTALDTMLKQAKLEALLEHGKWCDEQATSDWYGQTAGDMARKHSEEFE
jgi:hypothetical protein